MTMHAAAPGWYGDGSGTQRWWNGQGWTELLDHDPAPVPARITLADSDDDVEWLPRHGVVTPATSLEHGPLRRGRQEQRTGRRGFPTFAVVSATSMAFVTTLGFWLIAH